MKNKLYRIIDANLNRTCEGLRVIEDITRFCLDDKKLTSELKKIRHAVSNSCARGGTLLSNRDSNFDVGKEYYPALEGRKNGVKDIIVANFKRVQESLRVLEDVSKIVFPRKTDFYKKTRFRAYRAEQNVYAKF